MQIIGFSWDYSNSVKFDNLTDFGLYGIEIEYWTPSKPPILIRRTQFHAIKHSQEQTINPAMPLRISTIYNWVCSGIPKLVKSENPANLESIEFKLNPKILWSLRFKYPFSIHPNTNKTEDIPALPLRVSAFTSNITKTIIQNTTQTQRRQWLEKKRTQNTTDPVWLLRKKKKKEERNSYSGPRKTTSCTTLSLKQQTKWDQSFFFSQKPNTLNKWRNISENYQVEAAEMKEKKPSSEAELGSKVDNEILYIPCTQYASFFGPLNYRCSLYLYYYLFL